MASNDVEKCGSEKIALCVSVPILEKELSPLLC